eukprot:scaffold458818_cov41-Prasinocladus_malaysianus.AAC.1
MQRYVAHQQKQLAQLHKSLEACERRVQEANTKIAELHQELGAELQSELSAAEQAELRGLNARLDAIKKKHAKAQSARLQGQVEVQELESLLVGNLQTRQQ